MHFYRKLYYYLLKENCQYFDMIFLPCIWCRKFEHSRRRRYIWFIQGYPTKHETFIPRIVGFKSLTLDLDTRERSHTGLSHKAWDSYTTKCRFYKFHFRLRHKGKVTGLSHKAWDFYTKKRKFYKFHFRLRYKGKVTYRDIPQSMRLR